MARITKASNELGEIAGEARSLGPRRGAGWMALLTTCFIGASIADVSLPSSEDGLQPSTGDEQPAWDVDAPAFSAVRKPCRAATAAGAAVTSPRSARALKARHTMRENAFTRTNQNSRQREKVHRHKLSVPCGEREGESLGGAERGY